jgi:hypothetical protein
MWQRNVSGYRTAGGRAQKRAKDYVLWPLPCQPVNGCCRSPLHPTAKAVAVAFLAKELRPCGPGLLIL